MAELRGLGADMRGIAALKPSMEGVAELEKPMARVAALKEPMEQVAVLQRPLEDVSKLSPPMVEMAELGNAASSRVHYVIGAILGWGLMTFLAVYLGVQAASRRLRGRDPGSQPAPQPLSPSAPVGLPAADA